MYYGFDIGGTKIEFGAFDEKLERIATERVPTPTSDYDALISTLASLVESYDNKFGCEGKVGLGIPGFENATDGTVLTVNIPAASGNALRKDLETRLGRVVALNNDANCFALSEAWDDELKSEKSVLGLILGTGVGGGLILDGKVISGANNVAGEIGHTRIPIDAWFLMGENAPLFDCGCGNRGCADNYLSGRGFEQLYAHFNGEKKSAIDIISAYRGGDSKATEFVDLFLELLAMFLSGPLTAFDPDVVVIGGGLSNFDTIYSELPKRLEKHILSLSSVPKIIKAKHGDSGGVRGAAFLNI
ncbi:N-acetylglucosamine kinase [Veronia pacifica]|uniref:N-acetyl-D-glucosamine kinase n=1 Tax=Veronia pacifica TaxID=1080227 RepID=A0A1C3ECJ7_9GAMM|nr:N-acetylglucosamine kinase [Veronia pacifica]ODA30945.1 N-acetylglucosamine kinase [Veronia pacifica]